MTKKPTLEQHVRWGEEFKELQNRMSELIVDISKEVGKTRARRITDRMLKVTKLLAEAKYESEKVLITDFPEWNDDDYLFSNIYAGRIGDYQKIIDERQNKSIRMAL